ncbi:uncharacterized protein LOC125769443 [Anopheles funestus]|uniref:uncharacterized protein LOC125769443 n=1 Tax=Anopheles funestus TaxID=62324 RepID=UPI0020C5D8AE|nr:uncharacterized protein LOC125769443 [Anopheles funestus]
MLKANRMILKEKMKGSAAFRAVVSEELNRLGPPLKDATGWKKVWTDFKCSLKRKLANNNKEYRATGGGPCNIKSFKDVESRVLELMDMNQSAGALNISAFGTLPSKPNVSQAQDPQNENLLPPSNSEQSAVPHLNIEDEPVSVTHHDTSLEPTSQTSPVAVNVSVSFDQQNADEQNVEQSSVMQRTRKRRIKIRAECQLEAMQEHNKILEKRLEFDEERFEFDKKMRERQAEREAQQIELNGQQIQLQRQLLDKIGSMDRCAHQ